MRVLISCRSLGGMNGGQQRNVCSMIHALAKHSVTVVTNRLIEGGEIPAHRDLTVLLAHAGTPSGPYDMYLEMQSSPSLVKDCDARVKILMPSGDDVHGREKLFDRIALQTPAGAKYFADASKALYLPPPYEALPRAKKPAVKLPRRYFLTVFNPYSRLTDDGSGLNPYKGYDILARVAPQSPLPIVWCHSNRSIESAEPLTKAPNILHIEHASPGELRHLYEHATAYVCFSRDEGFGWAIADALAAKIPVISRDIGVLTMFENVHGIYRYKSEDQLLKWLHLGLYEKSRCEIKKLDPSLFLERLEDVLRVTV
ncbi:glycosyltransferase [Candidatus Peregrinibacteria bacterium]|nr:glycosyltransferase [Candidatus Peregrinibacteria bacterium]